MTADRIPTEQECIEAAAECGAELIRGLFRGTPREAAERAYTPTGPSVDEIERQIIAVRAAAYGIVREEE